jgi:hypothetical protein
MGRRRSALKARPRIITHSGVEYLTTDALVMRWGGAIQEPTLRNWRVEGYGPPYTKLGRRVVYQLSSLVEWEKRNTLPRP